MSCSILTCSAVLRRVRWCFKLIMFDLEDSLYIGFSVEMYALAELAGH